MNLVHTVSIQSITQEFKRLKNQFFSSQCTPCCDYGMIFSTFIGFPETPLHSKKDVTKKLQKFSDELSFAKKEVCLQSKLASNSRPH